MTRKYLDELGDIVGTRGNSSMVSIISEEATAYLRDPSVMSIKNNNEIKGQHILNESSIDKTTTSFEPSNNN